MDLIKIQWAKSPSKKTIKPEWAKEIELRRFRDKRMTTHSTSMTTLL